MIYAKGLNIFSYWTETKKKQIHTIKHLHIIMKYFDPPSFSNLTRELR